MRKLKEWKDAKGNKVSLSSGSAVSNTGSASSGVTNKSFKKRLNKLINYYGQHHPAKVEFITVNLLTNDTLDFTEYYDDRTSASYNIYIGPTTEAWRLKITAQGKLKDDIAGQGWPELLKTLRAYITVPVTTTLEYKDLLTEWLDSNGKKVNLSSSTPASTSQTTSSTFYKDKFKKLLDYHMANASYALSKNIDRLSEDDSKASFSYVEEFKNSKGKVCEVLVGVRYYKDTEAWSVKVWIDGHQVVDKEGITFNSLIADLKDRLVLPSATSSEYKDLCEWVDKSGKKVNLGNSSASTQPTSSSPKNYPSQEDRYKRLLAQIDSDNICKYTVNELTDRILDITVDTKFKTGLTIKIVYKPYVPCYMLLANAKEVTDLTYEEVLELLEMAAVINNNTDLCESAGSIAEDFKLYENLWENI